MRFTELIRISRPRFWLYLFWPILIALAVSGIFDTYFFGEDIKWLHWIIFWWIVIYCMYFLFPANLLIYWVNDLSDEDTDQWNEKKWAYENKLFASGKKSLVKNIVLRNIPFIVLLSAPIIVFWWWLSSDRKESMMIWIVFLLLFFFTGIFYSSLPIRAKAKPFLDGLFNVLYILPWFALYHFIENQTTIHWALFGAAWCRCVAMHTFSAIPDIDADKKAGLMTTAVLLWKNNTLFYCFVLWVIASIGGFLYNPFFWLLAWGVYSAMIYLSFQWPVFKIYKRFPLINALIWFILFWLIVLS
jgi:lycopene elongase/hydratase (dihydrobisanhydrobacterioruberin-forming)